MIGILIAVLLCAIVVVAIFLFSIKDDYFFHKKLNYYIESTQIKEIPIRELINTKWDKVCIYMPYNYGSVEYKEVADVVPKVRLKLSYFLGDENYTLQFIEKNSEVNVISLNKWILSEAFEDTLQSACFSNTAKFVTHDKKIINIID